MYHTTNKLINWNIVDFFILYKQPIFYKTESQLWK